MSQIAAVAAWGPGARAGVGGVDLLVAFRKGGVTSMHVGDAPGAQIAWATRAEGRPGEVQRLEGVGHMVPIEAPGAVAVAVAGMVRPATRAT